MIIGTAGHIDHGKTRLVRALTGVDTDRLKEEKARGISIELGYAYVARDTTDGNTAEGMLGFVDVPGHERFVHTMVAGATGIDFALLVIAADDGVMPQTREHLAILDLLGVGRGAIAVTKADRVDAARLEDVRGQIGAVLGESVLRDAPLFICNSTRADDPGIAALLAHLRATAATLASGAGHPARAELFRMPVDRVFSLQGHGTTVTGPVYGGRADAGDRPVLMPRGMPVRIRSIHAQNRAADLAGSGQRCALNLSGIECELISRGDWIADPRAFVATLRVDVRLRLLAPGTSLRDWTPLHVHWGTMHRLAHAIVLDARDDGRGILVQLVFDAPVCASTGDRFIVRNAAATATLGGGIVLDPEAPHRRRRTPARLAWLAALERLAAGEGMGNLLQQAPFGLAMSTLVRYCRLPSERIVLPADAMHVEGRDGGHVILIAHWASLAHQALQAVHDWHERHPDEPGIDSGRLRRLTCPQIATGAWQALLQSLHGEGRLQRNGTWWRLPGHDQALSERQVETLRQVLPLLLDGRFDPPWVRTVAAQAGEPEDRMRAVLKRAAARGEVYQVVPDLYYHPDCIGELAGIVDTLARCNGGVEAAAFRDAIGLGRKRSIQILEFFDRVGYTRRVGEAHLPRDGVRWNAGPAHESAVTAASS
ncbi:selenocysteine-specific translation elongation factor [Aerolutibacter ruishenii]|uniref:Selenocysteine-specific elongation factor n=1 Tax=Aerolutibacter ruishenii TaxID=686800 RepID=A0A562LVF3_9GAMM|nr:selenocysteine-specific translation elongation factor [Lysobacter ruishenii]TWI11533.1 selenocysteine-specific elongation factor [Lysobacter ruishenii]